MDESDGANFDVIVVGAGGYGLVAALAAAEGGAKVLLCEKMNWPGGNTALTASSLSRALDFSESGIHDTPELFVADIERRNSGRADGTLVRFLAERSAETAEFISEKTGIDFELSALAGHSADRAHSPAGWALVKSLVEAAEKHQNIEVRSSTPVRALVIGDDGVVHGVQIDDEEIAAHAVILATGGFAANPELVARFVPRAIGLPQFGHQGATGDGIEMGIAAGAALANLGGFIAYPHYFAPLKIDAGQRGIMVDQNGKRFVDETALPSPGAAMLNLPERFCYKIFDQGMLGKPEPVGSLVQGIQQLFAASAVEHSETPGGLADQLGIDAVGLQETVEEFNGAVGGQDRFGRKIEKPLGTLLFGFQKFAALYSMHCGLINVDAQVLRADGSVVPNLYAGGDVTEGICGPESSGYLPGNGTLTALV